MNQLKRTKNYFVEDQPISRHLYCWICHQVFDDPVRTACGHTFCYICIQTWPLIKQKNCPICNQSIRHRKLEKDFIASGIIDDLKTYCKHKGCTWQGQYSLFKKHTRNCACREKKSIEKRQVINSIDLQNFQYDCLIIFRGTRINPRQAIMEIQN